MPYDGPNPDLEGLLARLTAHGVEFVIVGGYAAVAHGATLVTQDVDVCCRFTPANLMALQTALRGIHPVHRQTPGRLPLHITEEDCPTLKNLYLDTDMGTIDCIGAVLGVGDFESVAEHSIPLDLGFATCRILDLETLIRAKEAMGRERDRQAVIQLQAIQCRLRGEDS